MLASFTFVSCDKQAENVKPKNSDEQASFLKPEPDVDLHGAGIEEKNGLPLIM